MKGKKIIILFIMVVFITTLLLSACASSPSQSEDDSQLTESEQPTIDFPAGPIDIIVAAGAGGGSDLMARAIAAELKQILKVPVNVINMPGGGGLIAVEELYSRPADGHAFLMENTSSCVLALVKGDREDKVDGITLFAEDTYGIHVKAGGKYETIDDFIAAAKANPGKLTIAGQGALSMDEFTIALLEKAADIDLTYVPYDQAGKITADLIGGHVDAIIDEFPPVLELIEAGEVKPILVLSEERLARYPDIPCSVEKGWNVTDGMHRFLTILKGTPTEVIEILEDAFKQVYNSEGYQEYHKKSMYDLKEAFAGYEETNKLIKRLYDEYSAIFEEMNFGK